MFVGPFAAFPFQFEIGDRYEIILVKVTRPENQMIQWSSGKKINGSVSKMTEFSTRKGSNTPNLEKASYAA